MKTTRELKFSQDHVWIDHIDNNKYQLGITDFAQDLLGDIVFVDIQLNKPILSNRSLGTIESVKTASDIVSPANIKVIGLNPLVEKCEITLDSDCDIENLLSYDQYSELIKE